MKTLITQINNQQNKIKSLNAAIDSAVAAENLKIVDAANNAHIAKIEVVANLLANHPLYKNAGFDAVAIDCNYYKSDKNLIRAYLKEIEFGAEFLLGYDVNKNYDNFKNILWIEFDKDVYRTYNKDTGESVNSFGGSVAIHTNYKLPAKASIERSRWDKKGECKMEGPAEYKADDHILQLTKAAKLQSRFAAQKESFYISLTFDLNHPCEFENAYTMALESKYTIVNALQSSIDTCYETIEALKVKHINNAIGSSIKMPAGFSTNLYKSEQTSYTHVIQLDILKATKKGYRVNVIDTYTYFNSGTNKYSLVKQRIEDVIVDNNFVLDFVDSCLDVLNKADNTMQLTNAVQKFNRTKTHSAAIRKGSDYLATYKPFIKLFNLSNSWGDNPSFNKLTDEGWWKTYKGGNLYDNLLTFDQRKAFDKLSEMQA